MRAACPCGLLEGRVHLANPACRMTRPICQFIAGAAKNTMSEPSTRNAPVGQQQIPEELALEIRRLAHDLSNALEIIVQTSYLLNMAELKEPANEWLRMLDSGVNKALELNLQLREYIKLHTPR
jgi:hypothetical protein